MKKVLIVIPFGIGDALFTTPMITALSDKFPGLSISYLTSGRAAPVLRNDPRLHRVFAYDRDEFVAVYRQSPWRFLLKWKGLLDALREEHFDVAFDLSLNGGIGLALQLAGIPRRIGHNYKGRGRFLTESYPLSGYAGRHVVRHHFDLLKSFGITDVAGGMRFFVSDEDEAWADRFLRENHAASCRLIGQFPGGGASWGQGGAARRWAPEKHAKLAEKIIEKGSCAIILMGDRSDREICLSVAEKMSKPVVIAAGQTTLGQSAALMKRCSCLVMNDGGAMHIAAALGIPTAVIFGPVDENVYGPFPVEKQVIASRDIPCRPCYRNFRMSDCKHFRCLKTLTVDEVFRKVDELL